MMLLPAIEQAIQKGATDMMTSRKRLSCALEHQHSDRVPVDLGATAVTGISHFALHRLRLALGLSKRPVRIQDPFQILGQMEEDTLQALQVDIAGIYGPTNFFGFQNKDWKKWTSPQGIEVEVGADFQTSEDGMGNTYIYPQGDRSAKPSAVLPRDGFYFDNIVRQEAVDEDHLDGRSDFKDQFTVYSDVELEFYQTESDHLYQNTDYGLILNFGGAAIGDAAFLSGPSMKKTPGIRRLEEWYMAHLLYPEYIKEVYDYQIEIALQNLELLRQAVGNQPQAIFMSGTDFGTQRSEFISPDMFREFYKPYYRKVNDWVHQNTQWKTFYHSCGSIPKLLDDFVDMGVDILNPVQCSAAGMDAASLKEKYGDRLVFWGGGVDTQKTLPFGTPEEVYAEVQERIGIFGKSGGFVFNPIHNIQANTPVENILAMFEAIRNSTEN